MTRTTVFLFAGASLCGFLVLAMLLPMMS